MEPEEEEINRQPVVQVHIDSLVLADSPRLNGADPDHVEAIAAAQHALPPIVVYRSTMRVIDGMHRVWAAILRGEKTIAARYFDGSEADAFVLAVCLNVRHGLPLALADRKRAAQRIINSHAQWSDRRVAAVTGMSPGTVADLRRRMGGGQDRSGRRIGQDGRVRPLDGTTGRRLAGQLMIENPDLSLRQVARAAAISPETARDVRNRLRNGEDPIPRGQRRGGAEADAATTRPIAATIPPGVGDHRPRVGSASVAEAGIGAVGLRAVRLPRQPVINRADIVNRLKADPALRYNETGRTLLRLLSLHMQWTEEWEGIVTNLPPHCSGVVVDLAEQFASFWADFATSATRKVERVC